MQVAEMPQNKEQAPDQSKVVNELIKDVQSQFDVLRTKVLSVKESLRSQGR